MGHLLALGIEQPVLHLARLCRQRRVVHLGIDMDNSLAVGCLQFGIDKGAEGCHADR